MTDVAPALAPAEAFRRLDPTGRQFALWDWLARDGHDLRRVWSSCPRGDWLAWWLASQPGDPRPLARACAECLRLAESGLPIALDAPRRLLLATIAWADERSAAPDHARESAELESLLLRDDWSSATRTTLQSALWLGRLVHPSTDAHSSDPSTAARLSLWHAAAAIACEVNPLEPPGSPWWVRCHEAALGRFAEVIRHCVACPA